jgi:hypothetical protein
MDTKATMDRHFFEEEIEKIISSPPNEKSPEGFNNEFM